MGLREGNMEITFKSIIRKKILVGITYMNKKENVIKMEQYVGKIIEADENKGIVVKENYKTLLQKGELDEVFCKRLV